jgi:hypothetical protein
MYSSDKIRRELFVVLSEPIAKPGMPRHRTGRVRTRESGTDGDVGAAVDDGDEQQGKLRRRRSL